MKAFERVFGALCLLKTIDLADRLPRHTSAVIAVALLAVWLAASTATAFGLYRKVAAGVLVVMVPAILVAGGLALWNQHLALIGWIGLWLALLDGTEQRMALRAQLSITYGFGALAKVSPWFLSGSVLMAGPGARFDAPDLVWVAAAWATVAIEAWLAVGLWFDRTRPVSVALGVVLHVGIVAMMATGPTSLVRMIVFNGLCVALYLPHLTEPQRRFDLPCSWLQRGHGDLVEPIGAGPECADTDPADLGDHLVEAGDALPVRFHRTHSPDTDEEHLLDRSES